MKSDLTKTCYTSPSNFGRAGTRVRIVMQSPNAVIWVNYGVHMRSRPFDGQDYYLGKDLKNLFPDALDKIEKLFGEDSSKAFLRHSEQRGMGTVLLDGGGDNFPLPNRDQRDETQRKFLAVTPTRDIAIKTRFCVICERYLPHLTNTVSVRHLRLTQAEDCAKLTNMEVIRVVGVDIRYPQEWQYIDHMLVSDGSYHDDHFCSDKCAAQYGRDMAKINLPRGRA